MVATCTNSEIRSIPYRKSGTNSNPLGMTSKTADGDYTDGKAAAFQAISLIAVFLLK